MKFSAVSLLALASVAVAKRELRGKTRNAHEDGASQFNADYQDHYLVSCYNFISFVFFWIFSQYCLRLHFFTGWFVELSK